MTPGHLLQVRDGYRFRNRSGLKNTEITRKATSADEEAAATFPVELKGLVLSTVSGIHWGLRMYPSKIKGDYCIAKVGKH